MKFYCKFIENESPRNPRGGRAAGFPELAPAVESKPPLRLKKPAEPP